MEPTFDQIEALLLLLGGEDGAGGMIAVLIQIRDVLVYLTQLVLGFGGLMLGSLVWNNFVWAKNQRKFL